MSASSPRELLEAAEPTAIQEMLSASRSKNAFLRANAIEASQPLPDRARPLAQLGLRDSAAPVRYTALVTIGKLRLRSLGDAAVGLLDDPAPSVRAAALFAARRAGQGIDISPLAGYLASTDPTVRSNAAMLLGMLGDRSAVPMLQQLARVPMPKAGAARAALTRLQIAEAMAKLGNTDALSAVRAGAYSQFDAVRVLAVQMIGRLHDRSMEAALRPMLTTPPIELQLAAASSLLATTQSKAGLSAILEVMLDGAKNKLPAVRSQAAFDLGQYVGMRISTDSLNKANNVRSSPMAPWASDLQTKAVTALVGLLHDTEAQVRLSAAAAIVKAVK